MEKFNDWVDGIQIGRFDREHLSDFTGDFILALVYMFKHSLEPRSTKEPEHHFDAEVGLKGLDPAATEKSREIGGGWVGSIQLSERGNEEQDRGRRHALTYHTSLNECQVCGV